MITIKVKILQCWKKSLDPSVMLNLLLALGSLSNSRRVIHYIMWNRVLILWVLIWRQLKNFWKCQISWLWRKITYMSKYSIWMKPLYSGNRCLKGLSLIRSPSQDQAFKYKIKILLRGYKATNWNPSDLAQWEPQGLQISISTHSLCTTGAIRSHGWPSSSLKMPSWIAASTK